MPSEQFLTRFYECPSIAQKLAVAVDAFVTASPPEKVAAEALLRKVYDEITNIPTRKLRKVSP